MDQESVQNARQRRPLKKYERRHRRSGRNSRTRSSRTASRPTRSNLDPETNDLFGHVELETRRGGRHRPHRGLRPLVAAHAGRHATTRTTARLTRPAGGLHLERRMACGSGLTGFCSRCFAVRYGLPRPPTSAGRWRSRTPAADGAVARRQANKPPSTGRVTSRRHPPEVEAPRARLYRPHRSDHGLLAPLATSKIIRNIPARRLCF